MSILPNTPMVELHIPDTDCEQEFLRLAVQTAVKKYRALHRPANLFREMSESEHIVQQEMH